MAQLIESIAIIKISKLVKDDEVLATILNDELITQLEEVLTQLIGDSTALVEVIKSE